MDLQFSAGAFIYRKENGEPLFLLMVKKNGEYDLAKGHIEKGESAEMAAIREIKEETGLDVDFIPYFTASTRYFFYERRRKVLKTVKFFLAEAKAKNVRVSYEHKGYEWVDYDSAVMKLKFKDLVGLMPRVREYIRRHELITAINQEYSRLPSGTKDWNLSKRLVPGEGRLDAEVVILGQAPGRNEDERLRPFIGRAGRVLDSMLRRARLRRDELYITSIVQFFPPENRIPTQNEIELCMPFLKRQLEVIKPRYVVLLGNVASAAMNGTKDINKYHGTMVERNGVKYFLTFHPAAALRFKEIYDLMSKDLIEFGKTLRPDQSRKQ